VDFFRVKKNEIIEEEGLVEIREALG